jgi:tetratricopeptide (TPR) repeat protein
LESNFPQHDETIVPVRPALGDGAGQAGSASAVPRFARSALMLTGVVGLTVAATAAFYWLPARVEQERAAVQPAAEPAPEPVPAVPELTPEEQAALRAQSGDLLAGLLTLQDELTRLNVADWAADDWAKYSEASEAGDNAFLADDFATAVERYSEAKALGEALVARAASTLAAALAAGDAALAAGESKLALEQYGVVLTIEPTHLGALERSARAERLPEVQELVQRAKIEVARGELTAALATYREALAIDSAWPAANDGVADVNRMLRDAEYERVLSAAYALLGDEDFTAAQREFEAALGLKPSSREAADGLTQAEQGEKLAQIRLAEARALAFERRELWDQAIELYRTVLESDGTLLFAQTGLERAQARAGLDLKLANLIENPALLLTDSVLADARTLLETAAAEAERGPRLTAQLDELGKLIDLASQPVVVQLQSDQLTSVTLYRVGALGAFAAKEIELRPGTYTVIGSRDGYRDVRRTFTVRPGRNLEPISVVCVEPI